MIPRPRYKSHLLIDISRTAEVRWQKRTALPVQKEKRTGREGIRLLCRQRTSAGSKEGAGYSRFFFSLHNDECLLPHYTATGIGAAFVRERERELDILFIRLRGEIRTCVSEREKPIINRIHDLSESEKESGSAESGLRKRLAFRSAGREWPYNFVMFELARKARSGTRTSLVEVIFFSPQLSSAREFRFHRGEKKRVH